MGAGKNKVLLRLGIKPVIFYAIDAFEKNNRIGEVIIVSKKEEIADFKKISEKYGFKKIKAVISGGKERQDSAFNALKYLKEEIGKNKKNIIIFHNGANPFVTQKEINQSIAEAGKHGACVVAHPTKDTVKEVDGKGVVMRTLERKKLWSMQTPQAIEFNLAYEAFSRADQDGFMGTDDVSLVERLGKKVKVIEGSPYNFKITHPIDLELAEIIIKKKYV
jgi:2-C-methyl-D-erythritol 4-phosphate cytidylyltransferase